VAAELSVLLSGLPFRYFNIDVLLAKIQMMMIMMITMMMMPLVTWLKTSSWLIKALINVSATHLALIVAPFSQNILSQIQIFPLFRSLSPFSLSLSLSLHLFLLVVVISLACCHKFSLHFAEKSHLIALIYSFEFCSLLFLPGFILGVFFFFACLPVITCQINEVLVSQT